METGRVCAGNVLVTADHRICLLDAGICVELTDAAHRNMVAIIRAMLEARGADAGRLMLATDSAKACARDRCVSDEAKFVAGIEDLVDRARHQTLFESLADYYGDICALAVDNRVALDSSFVSVALAVKIVEGLVMDLQPNFPILELAMPMFVKAQFDKATAKELGRLSDFSRSILKGNNRQDPKAHDFFGESS